MPDQTEYTVEYRNVKHPRLEFKTGKLLMILPKTGWTPKQVLEKYSPWIKRKQQTINTAIQQTNETTINRTRSEKELRTAVMQHAFASQTELKTRINKIYFRKMKTKWASHSKNNSLTINTLLKFLPEELISYIIFHETVHNIERKHNENFWNLIKRKHPDYTKKEKSLLTYWFLTQKTTNKPTKP
jgi:hypothetical protein